MTFEVKFYLKLLSRRLPVMLIIVLICAGISAVVATRLPTVYSTSATLLVERAQIPDRMVGVDFGIGANQQLELVQRRLMTRANLLEVARSQKVFPNIARMSPDEIVSAMRENTRIRRARGKSAQAAMTLGFEGPDPRTVAQVVNEYVTIILATSSDVRTERAQGTLDFFEQEVENLTQKLNEQSQKIVAFKNQNAAALPENLNYRLNRQSLLQERLARLERDLELLKTQRTNVIRLYEATGGVTTATEASLTAEQRELRRIEQELNVALTIYSEENPKIRLLRNRLNALQVQVDAQMAAAALETDLPQSTSNTALDVSLAEIDSRATALTEERTTIQTELAQLQDSIERTPFNRITLEAMGREMENMRQLYSSAAQRLNQARMGERVEVSAKGERITLLEPASVPDTPSSPNRMAIISGGVAVGMMLAIGLFVLLELFTQSIRRSSEIERKLEIVPLATLPVIETAMYRRRRRAKKLLVLIAICAVLGTGLWAVDTYYMRFDQLFERIMQLVG